MLIVLAFHANHAYEALYFHTASTSHILFRHPITLLRQPISFPGSS